MSAHFVHGCKHRAMPSLYRDYFLAKEGALLPVLCQATPTNSTAGPLVQMEEQNWPPTFLINDFRLYLDIAPAPSIPTYPVLNDYSVYFDKSQSRPIINKRDI